jgi:hypothetical protein
MPNLMMHAPASGNMTHKVNGRSYTGIPGTPQAIPDFDAAQLEANGWTVAGEAGTTATRPTNPVRGQLYNDTTVGQTIRWDGKTWRHPITGASV